MTVNIKIGRRIHRNNGNKKWFLRQVTNLKNTMSIQQYMWRTIEYGIKLATTAMDKKIKKNKSNTDYIFQYNKKKYIEEESLNYNIEWIELTLSGTYEEELDEYHDTMKFFDKLGNNRIFKQRMGKVEINEELAAEYHKKVKGKRAKKIINKGLDKVKDVTMAKALNDVGIIVLVEPPENPEALKDDTEEQ